MGQRCEISIRVSGAQPAIWLKSGAISSGGVDQNCDWTLLCLRIVKHTVQRRFYWLISPLSAATKPYVCASKLSYDSQADRSEVSVFLILFKTLVSPVAPPEVPGDPMSFHPRPSELGPGRAVPPLNGCFNDSSCSEDGRLEELLHVQPLISWHFDMSICQKHLSNNLFPIRVSFYCFLFQKKKKKGKKKLNWKARVVASAGRAQKTRK